jgi:hypothetical protein
MLLNALLIIFTLVLIVIAVGMVIWWKKFGKSFFEMSKNLSKMNQNMLKNQKIGNLGDFTKDFDEQMKIIQQFMKKK